LEMKSELQENAKLLKKKSEMKLFEFVSVLCEMQMAKLENKIIFLDEYEKLLHHEKVFLKVHQGQLLAEKLKLTGMKQKQFP
jgi:SWI/SNF related-matrix-associated actin-dependent regulator of chromatin subfamily C